MQLLCPKCHNVMHQYERNGVVVDQCTECKGLFLDRGELEKLVAAENGWYGGANGSDERRPAPAYQPGWDDRRRYGDDDDDDYRYRGDDHRYRGKRKRRSFLEDLFD